MEFEIVAGDQVQARKETPQGVIPLDFTATAVEDGVISGSPLGPLDPADGWTFELVRKGDPGLPNTLTDMVMWIESQRAFPIHVVGPVGGNFLTPQGERIDPATVLAWVPYGEYEPPEPDPVDVDPEPAESVEPPMEGDEP